MKRTATARPPMIMAKRTCRSCASFTGRVLTNARGEVNRVRRPYDEVIPFCVPRAHCLRARASAAATGRARCGRLRELIPLLPEAPSGWTAEKPEGSTTDVGGFKLTNVHRDYHKGESKDAPLASISILDSISNPDYVIATTAAWSITSESGEGYSKSVTIDGNPGFEAYEKDQKHASLWVMVAKRYFVQI